MIMKWHCIEKGRIYMLEGGGRRLCACATRVLVRENKDAMNKVLDLALSVDDVTMPRGQSSRFVVPT